MLKGLVSKKNLLLGLGIFFIFIMFINLFCTCEGFYSSGQAGGLPKGSGQAGGSPKPQLGSRLNQKADSLASTVSSTVATISNTSTSNISAQ